MQKITKLVKISGDLQKGLWYFQSQRQNTLVRPLTRRPWLSRCLCTHAKDLNDITAMLAKPSWSVKSLTETNNASIQDIPINQKQLHHLLRLSALPLPTTEQEEAKMINDLQSQLCFVRVIQNVNTEGVEPLRSLRDETKAAETESMITLESLQAEFDKEIVVGKRGRIVKKKSEVPVDTDGVENWDALAQAPAKRGRFFIVETNKD